MGKDLGEGHGGKEGGCTGAGDGERGDEKAAPESPEAAEDPGPGGGEDALSADDAGGYRVCERNTVAGLAEELAAAGHRARPLGIEISAELAKSASRKLKKLGGKCLHSDALSGLKTLPAGSVSLILMSAYLEHESRPAEVLAESARCLQGGGVVVLKVPNYACWNRRVMGARWCGFRYPDHVNYFTPATMRRMAEGAGLKVARGGWFDAMPTSDNMYAVLVKGDE